MELLQLKPQIMVFSYQESTSSMMTASAFVPDHSNPKPPLSPGSINARRH
jgi:hypothetical protein